jgi:lysophospholipase L1-like esterase
MIKSFLLAGCLSWPALLFSQRSIVVLGSSTAEGTGASAGHSWVSLTSQYLKAQGLIDTIYNLASGGFTTYDALPVGTPHPDGTHDPYPGRNVTNALSVLPLPKVVIISFPSNDLTGGVSLTRFLSNLRTMYDAITAAHSVCFLSSTQPRDDINPMLRALQKEGRDSILAEYPNNSLDFWDTLVDHSSLPDSLGIKAEYRVGDGIHINDAGHAALFGIVKASTQVLAPLPLTITGFSAWQATPSSVLIRWTTAEETGPMELHIQRGADGARFDDIEVETVDLAGSHDHSWTDIHILPGRSFYRLRASEGNVDQYSKIIAVANTGKALSLVKLYYPAGPATLMAEVSMEKDQLLYLAVLNNEGRVVRRISFAGTAPASTIPISLYNLASGQYFLQVTGAGGKTEARSFAFRH